MKTKQMQLHCIPLMVCLVLITTAIFLPAVSCRKSDATTLAMPGLQNIARTLQGEIINGSISTESDDDGVAFWCNDGKILIGIEKIASQEFADPGTIRHAQVVYSNYGIVIQDTDTNRLWYYIQNDEKSIQQFKALQHKQQNCTVSAIAGTIKLNISRGS